MGGGFPETPANGTNVYSNPSIKYLKYTVYKNGFGYLFESQDYERLSNGGFKLLGTHLFSTDECYTIKFYI